MGHAHDRWTPATAAPLSLPLQRFTHMSSRAELSTLSSTYTRKRRRDPCALLHDACSLPLNDALDPILLLPPLKFFLLFQPPPTRRTPQYGVCTYFFLLHFVMLVNTPDGSCDALILIGGWCHPSFSGGIHPVLYCTVLWAFHQDVGLLLRSTTLMDFTLPY